MKRIFTILGGILFSTAVWAQSPQMLSYQAVVRDGSNNLVATQVVGMQISILQGSASGTPIYVETQTPTTNTNGLVSVQIGTGTTTDSFSAIDWANGSYFIKTETDPTGGTNYSITGTSQLLSVPFALYAAKSGSSVPGPQGIQGPAGAVGPQGPAGTNQTITQVGNTVTLSDGGGSVSITDNNTQLSETEVDEFVTNNGYSTTDTQLTEAEVDAFANNNGYLTTEVDGDIANEIQDLQLTGNTLTITNNGSATSIDLSAYLDNTDTQLSEAEVDAFANNNSYLTAEVDGDIANEIQDLQLIGNTLTITNNGSATSIDLSTYLDNTDTQLSEAEVDAFANNNGHLTTEIDGSITNEIQDLQLAGNILTITNNGAATSIDLSAYLDNTNTQLTEAEVDAFANNNSYLTAEIDGSTTNEIQNLSSVLTQSNSAENANITNLADPVNNQDAATKSYVDFLKHRVTVLELAGGASAASLYTSGVTIPELIAAGATVAELVLAGATPAEFYGLTYQGGIIFYVAGDGSGLVAAPANIVTAGSIFWDAGSSVATGATATAIGSGQANTTTIVTTMGVGNGNDYGAMLCNDYTDGTYSDWFLPSYNELLALYTNLHLSGLGSLDGGQYGSRYWSSTENNATGAKAYNFYNGLYDSAIKTTYNRKVRAVRAF